MAVSLTETQKSNVRRFTGYPALGEGLTSDSYWRLFPDYDTLEARLRQLNQADVDQINKLIEQIQVLEDAIFCAAGNLAVSEVASVVNNPREIAQRERLFTNWRFKLVDYLGVAAGPGLSGGNSVRWRV